MARRGSDGEGAPRAKGPFGTQVTPQQALLAAAEALCPPMTVTGSGAGHVELRDHRDVLPDVTFRLRKERRLFSRTFALVVEASATGHGPNEDAAASLNRSPLRRRLELEPFDPMPASREWSETLQRSGLLEGVRTMTNVVALQARWHTKERTGRLRLTTLAGALIGTSPTTSVAVPLEPEDVEGLLRILAAVSAAVQPPA